MSYQKSVSILASSSLAQGARNRSADGSSFNISLNDAIHIPDHAQNIMLEVEKATIWHVSPNYKATNNQIYVSGQNTLGVVISRLITLPVGLYDVNLFRLGMATQLENAGFKTTPLPVIDFAADYATNRIVIKFNYIDSVVDFRTINAPNSMNAILGFNLLQYTTVSAPYNLIAPNIAQFNAVNSILILSNLSDNGFPVNGLESNICSQVLINVSPGSQIVYEPNNSTQVSASNLQGRILKDFNVSITDENLVGYDTYGENYTVLFKITWY